MQPPFRADQVGSLLRPAELTAARSLFGKSEIDAAALRAVEDRCIRAAIAKQESLGLQAVTDGEFRRDWWHVDFLAGFDGVEGYVAPLVVGFKNTEEQPPMIRVTGGQRIDLLGVKKEQLPAVWEDLGMPSGYAYAKAVRTVRLWTWQWVFCFNLTVHSC